MSFRPKGEIPHTLLYPMPRHFYLLRPGDFSAYGLEMT
jgi:hypothetical protein